MSKYTTELRYVCESYAKEPESVGYDDVAHVIDKSWDKVFSFDFPIFDENYREALCKKIIKHYYTREIAEETVGLWKLRLDARMNEIMPYFNKLYDSELVAISPLINYRVNTTRSENKGGSDAIVDSGSESVAGTSGNSRVTTGGYTDTHTGTDTGVKTGNETLGMAGKETDTKSGKETDTKSGTKTVAKIGNIEDTTEYDGDKVNTHKVNQGTLDTTVVDLFTDTPQGNIANMGTGYGSGSSTSDVPIVGDDTAWLTTANKTTTNENDTREIEDRLKYENDYKETKKRTYNGENNNSHFRDEESFNNYKTEKEFSNYKDEKTFQDRVDTKTYNNVTNTETKNLTDTRTYNNENVTDTGNTSKNTIKGNNRNITYGSTNAYLESVLGSKGKSDAELLMEFRKSFLNIDEMIIKQLSDLFIYLW